MRPPDDNEIISKDVRIGLRCEDILEQLKVYHEKRGPVSDIMTLANIQNSLIDAKHKADCLMSSAETGLKKWVEEHIKDGEFSFELKEFNFDATCADCFLARRIAIEALSTAIIKTMWFNTSHSFDAAYSWVQHTSSDKKDESAKRGLVNALKQLMISDYSKWGGQIRIRVHDDSSCRLIVELYLPVGEKPELVDWSFVYFDGNIYSQISLEKH